MNSISPARQPADTGINKVTGQSHGESGRCPDSGGGDGFQPGDSSSGVRGAPVCDFIFPGDNYRFATGTPSFLIEPVKKTGFDLDSIHSRPVSSMVFNAFGLGRLDLLTLLQTGYLTIKSMVNACVRKTDNYVADFCEQPADAMNNGNVKQLRKVMETILAGISYEHHHQADFSDQSRIIFRYAAVSSSMLSI